MQIDKAALDSKTQKADTGARANHTAAARAFVVEPQSLYMHMYKKLDTRGAGEGSNVTRHTRVLTPRTRVS